MEKKSAAPAKAAATVNLKKAATKVAKSSGAKAAVKKTTDNKGRSSKSVEKGNAGSKLGLNRSATEPKGKGKSGALAGSKRLAAKPATKLVPASKASGTKAAATKKPKRK